MVTRSLALDDWADHVSGPDGTCWVMRASSRGWFEEAQPWYERAVAAAEKGDVHGRVDADSLGRSLHQVGDCHAKLRQLEAATRCHERAAAQEAAAMPPTDLQG